jgi:DNA-binding IscR family transcriptional regulator
VEGPIFFNKCLYDEANCNLGRSTTCQLNKAFSGIQSRIVDELEKTTLENILKF